MVHFHLQSPCSVLSEVWPAGLTQRRCDVKCLNRSSRPFFFSWQGWRLISGPRSAGYISSIWYGSKLQTDTLSNCCLSKMWISAIWPLICGRPVSCLPEESDRRTSANPIIALIFNWLSDHVRLMPHWKSIKSIMNSSAHVCVFLYFLILVFLCVSVALHCSRG